VVPRAEDTLAVIRKALEGKGVSVHDEAVLTRKDCSDSQKVNALIDLMKNAMAF
jgi:hypothetical protein